MLTDLSVIEGEYLRDILDQPHALEATLAGLQEEQKLSALAERLRKGEFRTVVLTGMGSSFHALHPLRLKLTEMGAAAILLETSELIHYNTRLLSPENVLVVVSQSGQSAEVVHLLDVNGGKSAVIAVTNTPGSPLAKRADAAILTQAGKEFSVSCKTYVASMMALQWLGDIICNGDVTRSREELSGAAAAAHAYLLDWKSHVQSLAGLLKGVRNLFLVGRGPSLAAVGTGALIIKESDHFPAEGMSSAAFRHGPFDMLGEETFVLVFSGESRTEHLNRKLVDDICEEGGRAEIVMQGARIAACSLPSGPPSIQPILEILPVQMITLALGAQAGREPGRFELATKVTTTE